MLIIFFCNENLLICDIMDFCLYFILINLLRNWFILIFLLICNVIWWFCYILIGVNYFFKLFKGMINNFFLFWVNVVKVLICLFISWGFCVENFLVIIFCIGYLYNFLVFINWSKFVFNLFVWYKLLVINNNCWLFCVYFLVIIVILVDGERLVISVFVCLNIWLRFWKRLFFFISVVNIVIILFYY